MYATKCFRENPPTVSALTMSALDTFVMALPWVGILYYGYKIAPPDLIGTMTAMTGMFQFVIGK